MGTTVETDIEPRTLLVEIGTLEVEEVMLFVELLEVATERMLDEDRSEEEATLDEASEEMEAEFELEMDCDRDGSEETVEEPEESAEVYVEDTADEDEVICSEETVEELEESVEEYVEDTTDQVVCVEETAEV